MPTTPLSPIDRQTISLALDHSWDDLTGSIAALEQTKTIDPASRAAIDGLVTLSLQHAEALTKADRAAAASVDEAEARPRVARFLKAKGRLTDLVQDLGGKPLRSRLDIVDLLAPAVGRLLVNYAGGVATVLLGGKRWHQTGEEYPLRTGGYSVSLGLPQNSYQPLSLQVVIAPNTTSTANFT